MRQDQILRLTTLSESLTDVFLDEAEPSQWPGAGLPPGAMDQQTRGDRYWCKKNAVATLSLVGRIQHLFGLIRAPGADDPGAPNPADELEKEITQAEKEAAKLLDKVQEQARKREFDDRVHGSKG